MKFVIVMFLSQIKTTFSRDVFRKSDFSDIHVHRIFLRSKRGEAAKNPEGILSCVAGLRSTFDKVGTRISSTSAEIYF